MSGPTMQSHTQRPLMWPSIAQSYIANIAEITDSITSKLSCNLEDCTWANTLSHNTGSFVKKLTESPYHCDSVGD